MILKGKVKSGFREASFWMKKAEKAFYDKTGIKMFHGTLNIELDSEYILKDNIKIIHKEEYGGVQEVYIQECKIFGNKSYIIRTERNMTKNGDHPLNLLEIISNVNFRKTYNLKDGDEVEIEIDYLN